MELSDADRERLERIGEFSSQSSMLEHEFRWEQPAALANEWTSFDLLFFIETGDENIELEAALSDVLKVWEGIAPRFPQRVAEFESALREVFLESDDEDDADFEEDLDGMHAICLQHEMDHLEGKLFVDYLSPLKRRMVQKKLEKQRKIADQKAARAVL